MNQYLLEEIAWYLGKDEPTKADIKNVLTEWIRNLASQIGEEAHAHSEACGISLDEDLTWEEHDRIVISQISEYTNCLLTLG